MYKVEERPVPRTESSVVITFSQVASFVFHPLFMTFLAAFSSYCLLPGELATSTGARVFGSLAVYTIILPFCFIIVLRAFGIISNARMHQPRDRIFPMFATIACYLLAYLLADRPSSSQLLRMLLLGSVTAIVVVFVVNFFYKVSVHTTAAGILPGFCIALMLNDDLAGVLPLFIAVIVAATVGAIRWLLGAHTPGQILLGYAIGVLAQLAAYFYLYT